MVENHTRDLLQMKAKETQLARSRNDAELTQAALSKAQRDLEALRQSNHADTFKELEIWKSRAEKAEQRIFERDQLDQNVLGRLTDLEEFIRGLDDETPDADIVSRMSSRCKDLEDQNRRLQSQMEEYSSRITTLEEVPRPFHEQKLIFVGSETSNYITIKKRKLILLSIINIICIRRRKRKFIWQG